jgi:integrase
MPRPRSLKPKYCLHKPSGRAYVFLDGRRTYLGPHGSQESLDAYDRAIGEWIARGRRPLARGPAPQASGATTGTPDGPTVRIVLHAFWTHAQARYAAPPDPKPDRRPAGELGNYRDAMRPLKRLYAALPAEQFTPPRLKALRLDLIARGWCRNYINRQIKRIQRIFGWAVGEEWSPGVPLVPPAVAAALASVEGLRKGEQGVRETPKVRAARPEIVAAVLDHLSPPVRAMVELQDLTGMRSTEVCILRTCDVDRSVNPWVYKPATHKTAHLDIERQVHIGPKGQAVLTPFLRLHEPDAYVFQPAESEQWRHGQQRERRLESGTPLTPSQRARLPRTNRRRPPGQRYDRTSYRRAVQRACDAAFPPPGDLAQRDDESIDQWKARLTPEQMAEVKAWRKAHRLHPHQLRHAAATRIRGAGHGIDGVQAALGQKTPRMATHYAEVEAAKAAEVMRRIG